MTREDQQRRDDEAHLRERQRDADAKVHEGWTDRDIYQWRLENARRERDALTEEITVLEQALGKEPTNADQS